MPLEPQDQVHLTAAEGYAELGMYVDANEALDSIAPDFRHLPEVLAVRLYIYSSLKKWDLMRTVAAKLAAYDPGNAQWAISLAYATRRAASIEAARPILEDAAARIPGEPMLHFNLACYECQLGNMEAAKSRLSRRRWYQSVNLAVLLDNEVWLCEEGKRHFQHH